MMQDLSVQGSPAREATASLNAKVASEHAAAHTLSPAQPSVLGVIAPPAAKKPRYVHMLCIPEPGDYIVCGGRKSQVLDLQVGNSEDVCEELQAGRMTCAELDDAESHACFMLSAPRRMPVDVRTPCNTHNISLRVSP